MELSELRVFLKVAAERSFSRAAMKLHRTQPAVSQAVRRLEDSVGERLFDRATKDATLTEAGRLLRDYAHGIECRQTPRALRELTDSFCIADDLHIVRRFHSDHLRGEAAFDAPQQTELSCLRFDAIWAESQPGLQASVTGL